MSELLESRPVYNDIDTTVGSANITFYEWNAKKMENHAVADECYRLKCSYQIELCRMLRGWSIKELAKRLSVSKSFVKAVIKSEVQLTVYEFIRWLRVMGYETKIETKDIEESE